MNFVDFATFVKQTDGCLTEWSTIQLGNVAEATIHPRFRDFIEYIRSQSDATILIVTNGKLLHRYADLINKVGNCTVLVSMDSVEKETHEYIREGSDYDQLMLSLNLLDLKRTQVIISFTLMSSNISQYDSMVEFCQQRGYKMGAFPMMLREERGIIPYQLLKESLWFKRAALGEWLSKHYGKNHGEMMVGAATQGVDLTEFNCNAHNSDLAVDASGTVMLCGMKNLGNLKQSSLEELWLSDEALAFRAKVDFDRSPCMSCNYRQRCLAPSMFLLDNHFSATIASAMSAQTRAAIAFDRAMSDSEALDRFMRDLSQDFGFFEILRDGGDFVARRMTGVDLYEEEMRASSRPELYGLMTRATKSAYDLLRVETDYKGYNICQYRRQFWGIPRKFGQTNITIDAERAREGVLVADSIDAVRLIIDKVVINGAPATPQAFASATALASTRLG